jgi:hypothetical protein
MNAASRDSMANLDALFEQSAQMTFGEQAAIEGVLARLRPRVSIELGTASGGSLSRIAQWSSEVHTFDFAHRVEETAFPNVTFHRGDSGSRLPEVLRELEARGTVVDFVLVDGDHSPDGVQRDVEALLGSTAVVETVIVLHDTANEGVRQGIRSGHPERHGKVVYADLSFVPTFDPESPVSEAWGGLGLIVVDAERSNWPERRAIKPNVAWSTTTRAAHAWRFVAPGRRLVRPVAYRVRKLVRERARRLEARRASAAGRGR